MKTPPLLALILSLGLGLTGAALGQGDGEPVDVPVVLSQSGQHVIVQRLIKRIEDFYVLQSDAPAIANRIRQRHEEGAYRELTDPQQFARQLTLDLRDISQDAHFAILHDPTTFLAMEAQLSELDGPDSRAALAGWLQDDQATPDIGRLAGNARRNFFFSKLEILEGNVGYLRLDQIPALEPAQPTVHAAMAFLSNTDAVIIDVRGNRGGVGGFIPYLMSYFFPEGVTTLYKRDFQAVGVVEEYSTVADLPGERLDDVPLFVLIDPVTGSAARNLSYTLQSFGRARLVGEASGDGATRGAHSGGLFPLAEGLLGVVPIGRVVNARTNTNWRDDGVRPDVSVAAADALVTAHQLAVKALLERVDDATIREELSQALGKLDTARTAPAAPRR